VTAPASPRRSRRRQLAPADVASHPAPLQRLPALRHRRQPGQPRRERAPAAARHHHNPLPQQLHPPRRAAAA
jgi:hypothetical protein